MKTPKKLKRRSLRKSILAFLNIGLLAFAAIMILTLLFNVILPSLEQLKKAQTLYNVFSDTLGDFNSQTPETFLGKFFNFDQIKNHLDQFDPQVLKEVKIKFENLTRSIDELVKKLEASDGHFVETINASVESIINSIRDLAKIPTKTGTMVDLLNADGQTFLDNITDTAKVVNDVNDLLAKWLNLNFDTILTDIKDGGQIDPQALFSKYFNTVINSKLVLLVLSGATALVFAILFALYLLISAIKFKINTLGLDKNLRPSGLLTTLNILTSLTIVLSWLTWLLIWIQCRFKLRRALKAEARHQAAAALATPNVRN